jgi:hypothetical protein
MSTGAKKSPSLCSEGDELTLIDTTLHLCQILQPTTSKAALHIIR